jgi:hypothetical protein
MSDPRPIPLDPSHDQILSMIEVDQSWLMTASGDYDTFAVEAMTRDGSNWQRVIALRWPARINKTDEKVMLRMLISPEDAIGLAAVMTHTAKWLMTLAAIEGDAK